MSLVDVGWVYTLVQSAATFVAIVGAFFTTKVLSISSEVRSTRNRIRSIETELGFYRQKAATLRAKLDEYSAKWAGEDVPDYLEGRLVGVSEGSKLPTLDELKQDFLKSKDHLDEFEEKTLESNYQSFSGKWQTLSRRTAAQAMIASMLPGVTMGYLSSRALLRSPEIKSYNSLFDERRTLLSRIELEELRRNELEEQVKSLAFPRYTELGFSVLVYFGVVGVVVPLLALTMLESLTPMDVDVFLFLFASGFAATVIYLLIEVVTAVRGKASSSPSRQTR